MNLEKLLTRGNNNLDLIRLLMALFVILGHTPVFLTAQQHIDPFSKLFGFTYMGAAAVKVFFFISGLLITNSLLVKNNWKTYISSRFFRIWPALIFTCVATSILCYFIQSGDLNSFLKSASRYIRYNIILQTKYNIDGVSFFINDAANGNFVSSINGSLWTIPYEVAMYALLFGVYFLASNFPEKKKILTVVSIIFVASPFFDPPLHGSLKNEEILYLLPCFFLGALFAIYKDKIYFDWKIPTSFFMMYSILHHPQLKHLMCYFGIVTLFVWISSLSIVRKIKLNHDISYGVYLWGWPVQQFCHYLFPHIGYWTYVALCMSVAIAIAYASAIFIEEPCMRISSKLNKRYLS